MPWDKKARDRVFELNLADQPENVIVRTVTREQGCNDKTVRRCFTALCLIVAQRDRVPEHSLKYLQDRATMLEVTEHYLTELRYAYTMFLDRHSIQPSVWNQHWMDLADVVTSLRGTGVWALANLDLATWWSRKDADPTWPIGGAKVTRFPGNKMSVALDEEALPEWAMLQQHLPNDPMWRAAEAWRASAAEDTAARIDLFSAISNRIEALEEDGGLGIALSDDLLGAGAPDPCVSLHYAFHLHRHLLGGLFSSREQDMEADGFRQSGSDLDILYLHGDPVVKSADSELRRRATEFFVSSQRTLRELPQARKTRGCWLRNRELEQALHAHAERVAALSGLPVGSRCASCPILVHG